MEYHDFNTKYRERTKKFAVDIIRFYVDICKNADDQRISGKQLLRSGTSIAASFRVFTHGHSDTEKYSRLCIVL